MTDSGNKDTKTITITIKGEDLCTPAFVRKELMPMIYGIISGGPIEHLEKGWALMPFVGKKAHYWIEDKDTMPPQIRDGGRVRYYTSRCGISAVTDKRTPALQPGDWPLCKRCNVKSRK